MLPTLIYTKPYKLITKIVLNFVLSNNNNNYFMSNDIYLIGEVGWEITLDSVIKAVENSDKEKDLNIKIHSMGGSVYDGLAIYNYLKSLDQTVHTASAGLVASIASIFFLAGKKETRKINSTDSFLIHLPSSMDYGNASDLEKTAKELREIEGKLSDIYAKETSLTKEEALELMGKDEMLDINFLKEKEFVNEIVEFKAVAKYNNKNKNKMADKKTMTDADKTWFETFFNKILGKQNPTNKLVQDANGDELDFVDLADDETPKVGDKAKFDGKDADGDYTMPNGDVWNFVSGELTTITESDDDDDESVEALKQKIADLESQAQASATETETITNKVTELKASNKEKEDALIEIKAKLTSSFEWNGKEKRDNGKKNKTRTIKRIEK